MRQVGPWYQGGIPSISLCCWVWCGPLASTAVAVRTGAAPGLFILFMGCAAVGPSVVPMLWSCCSQAWGGAQALLLPDPAWGSRALQLLGQYYVRKHREHTYFALGRINLMYIILKIPYFSTNIVKKPVKWPQSADLGIHRSRPHMTNGI